VRFFNPNDFSPSLGMTKPVCCTFSSLYRVS
jgi:hypothetical protein